MNRSIFALNHFFVVEQWIARWTSNPDTGVQIPNEEGSKKNLTVKYFNNNFFLALGVPTMRFGGSFLLPITFYVNLFGRGVTK